MRFVNGASFSNFMIMRVLRADLRVVGLCLAIAVYAVLGSPTPDVIGGVEVVVGGLLLFAVGAAGFVHVLKISAGRERWFILGQVFLFYGLIVGGIGGLTGGQSVGEMVRDILPFGFMFLPLFLVRYAECGGAALWAFALLGIVFAVRAGAYGAALGGGYDALYYLGNSPTVLFAAMFFFGLALLVLSRQLSFLAVVKAGGLFALCLLALVPIVITAQRVGMAAFCLYTVLVSLALFMQAPRRMIFVVFGLFVLVLLVFGVLVQEAFDGVVVKSALVGANMRFEEWAAVWDEITAHPLSLLFGRGWGASFSSPAVADIEVYFTHSLLSSMLLKTGLVGFLMCVFYIGALFVALLREVKRQPLVVMAIAAPLLIDVFLYAAFKSLDFGLLLALIPVVVFSGGLERESIAS